VFNLINPIINYIYSYMLDPGLISSSRIRLWDTQVNLIFLNIKNILIIYF
jgi:hypothetical protein